MAERSTVTRNEVEQITARVRAEERGPYRRRGLEQAAPRPMRTGPVDVLLPPAPDPWAARVQAQALAAADATEVPAYGSPEFDALPETSPLRVAAAVAAAEAWRTYWSPEEHARRLELELAAGRAAGVDGADRLADAIGWAAGAPGRVEVLAAAATRTVRETAVDPAEQGAARPLVADPAWPALVAPPGVEVIDPDQLRLIRQVGAVGRELRTEHAGSSPPAARPRLPQREQTAVVAR